MGLEPTTFSLATRRSTTELCPLIKNDYKYQFLELQVIIKKCEVINLLDYNLSKYFPRYFEYFS